MPTCFCTGTAEQFILIGVCMHGQKWQRKKRINGQQLACDNVVCVGRKKRISPKSAKRRLILCAQQPQHKGRIANEAQSCGTRRLCKFECFSFDVAYMQCGHPHSHQQVPFACIALRIASRVLWGLGLKVYLCTFCTNFSNPPTMPLHQKTGLSRCVI